MRFETDNNIIWKSSKIRFIAYTIIALLISVAHLVLLDFIAISGITPDLLVLLCVWIALREGQFIGIIAGFFCGLIFDFVSYDIIGTNALSKLLVGFIAGYFYKEDMFEHTVGSYKFLMIVFVASMSHNLVYYFFYLKVSEMSFIPFFLKYGIAMSFYTTVISLIPFFFKMKQKIH